MGIKGLAKLLSDEAPDCIREVELKSLHGRKIAIDASMAIYQFLIAVRSGGPNQQATMLTNADGETTSHIQGMFNRTIRFLTEGMKPCFVFDGKAPNMKSGELEKRREKRRKAEEELKKATEEENVEEIDKQSKRLARAGRKENADCQKLLRLMGVPVIMAPMEAEAEAAALCRAGLVWATGTEDMDALTFQTPVLIRKLTFANASSKNATIQQIDYKKAVEGLELTHDQFVDLCILLGCDYCDNIKGIGPKTALKLIREHGSIEKILPTLDRKKYTIPKDWIPNEKESRDGNDTTDEEQEEEEEDDENVVNHKDDKPIPTYVQARELFHNHETTTDVELKWTKPDSEALTKFLVDEQGFSAERVKSNIEKLEAAYKANLKPQTRMDSFFTVKSNPAADAKRKQKREEEEKSRKKPKASIDNKKKRGGFKKK
ncbi:XPG I domain containing protein [Nitzschia inconspicua]|uniref:Flap endonuclease 1 n=1 Tax=Nitzschia inconspicua TaxID=303405 RepID=A0A9K3P9Q2_9STRA|nr:XPG I domain containing protein [Nitzschia inconspicua]KAG7362492.1 XPG I domain containing protein [Nitzschia inconspicua]